MNWWLMMLLPVWVGCSASTVQINEGTREILGSRDGRSVNYRFGPVPGAWERIEIEDNDVAWHDRQSHGVIHVNHQCLRGQDSPLPALVQQLLIGFTDREIQLEENIAFDGREARHVKILAKLDGVPTSLELFVMKKDGCVFDLGLVVAPDHYVEVGSQFGSFATGFSTLSTGMPAQTVGSRP